MLAMSVLMFTVTVYAFAEDPVPEPEQSIESLRIEDVRMVGYTLYATVTDKDTGLIHDLEIDLTEYADLTSGYISIPLSDITGNASDYIYFRNPFYIRTAESVYGSGDDKQGDNPFTHDGTGTVIDNATDGDGKEFFSIETPDGNVFYLIIDRQRTAENVYLLNAVTENDLMSLAEPGDGRKSVVEEPPFATPEPEPIQSDNTSETAPVAEKSNNSTIIFIIIAVIAVGGAGYYFKIIRPKENVDMDDDDEDEEEDENNNEEQYEDEEIDITDDTDEETV